MFKRILVVCVGNICRSPTAERLLRQQLATNDVQVTSAGLGALVGRGIEPMARDLLVEHEVPAEGHHARQLDDELVAWADLILVMQSAHLQAVVQRWPYVRGRTFLLGKWLDNAGIPDPYRQQRPAFEHVYDLIARSVSAWLPYLQ